MDGSVHRSDRLRVYQSVEFKSSKKLRLHLISLPRVVPGRTNCAETPFRRPPKRKKEKNRHPVLSCVSSCALAPLSSFSSVPATKRGASSPHPWVCAVLGRGAGDGVVMATTAFPPCSHGRAGRRRCAGLVARRGGMARRWEVRE